MSIIETVNSTSHFYQWLQSSSGYKNNFSYEGANTVQDLMEQLSDDLGEPIEFDPIAWCCTYSEYDTEKEVLDNYNLDNMDELRDNTQVVVLDNGHIIIEEF